jgi:DNA-binding CsgD family transcriptional regulator
LCPPVHLHNLGVAGQRRIRGVGVPAREAEVLAALGEHLTNAEISARLFISVRTVESHVSSLLRKLRADDRRALAAAADDVRSDPAAGSAALPSRDAVRRAVGRAGGAVGGAGGAPPGHGRGAGRGRQDPAGPAGGGTPGDDSPFGGPASTTSTVGAATT